MAAEEFTLDGLELHSDPFSLVELDLTPPAKTLQWAKSADQDGAVLVRPPFHEQREIKLAVQVEQQASMDDALDAVGSLVDKLQSAERAAAGGGSLGLEAVYTPAGSTYSFTFYVQAGEITGLPVGWEDGWLAKAPRVEVVLWCATAGYGAEVVSSVTTATDPIIEKLVTGVAGDLAAEGRLVVQDNATLVRDHVEFGLDQPPGSSPIILDSDSLVVTGFAGVQTTQTGAYDPGASGNNVIRATLSTTPVTICSTGDQPHVGSFRVKARVYAATAGVEYRLSWREGRDPFAAITWTEAPVAGALCEVDLGMVTISEATLGSQAWEGRVQGQATTTGDTADVDALWLVPVTAGYGKARAPIVLEAASAILARDSFQQSAGALNGKVLAAAQSLSGPLNPATLVDDAGTGTIGWTTPSNAASSNNSYTTAALTLVETSHYLKATGFGFALPATATVDGIVVDIERKAVDNSGPMRDNRVRIVKGGTIQTADKASADDWPFSDAYKTYGAANDLWSNTWAYTDINAATFGVAISLKRTATDANVALGYIDHVRVTVYYTDSAGVAWTTVGDADDFAINTTADTADRTAVSDASIDQGRFAVIPSVLTTTGVAVEPTVVTSASGSGELLRMGPIARYIDVSNWLLGMIQIDYSAATRGVLVAVIKRVAGASTVLAQSSLGSVLPAQPLTLLVDALGTCALFGGDTLLAAGADSALATGGVLASGKPGFYDAKTGADAATRSYDDFSVWAPEFDHVGFPGQTVEFRAAGDPCSRADSSGLYYGRPPEYNGSRFWLPTGDSRVAVKARRADVDNAADANIADSTKVTVHHRPRWLVIPRST